MLRNLLTLSLMFLLSNISVNHKFTHMVMPYHLLLFYFNQDRLDDILCSLRESIRAGKMNRLDELENRSIYIVRKAYSYLEKIITLGSIRKDSTFLFVLSRKAFQGTVPFPVIHIDTGKKSLNTGKTSSKNELWYGTST
jgi:hypothetical protein